jgi:hypothetical protein
MTYILLLLFTALLWSMTLGGVMWEQGKRDAKTRRDYGFEE